MEKDQQIQEEYHAKMNAVARALDEYFNPDGARENGFILLCFKFGEPSDAHRMNYISNGRREDCIASMKEFIAHVEGRHVNTPGNA